MYLLFNIIAFCAGAIIGVVLTACIVAADWHEKPRRHRGWWMKASDGYAECTNGLTGIEAVCTANAIKYLWRWKRKNGVEDLKKAVWYIQHLIDEKESTE